MELFKNGLRNQSDLKAPEPITTKLAEPSGTGIRALLSDIIEAANALQQARDGLCVGCRAPLLPTSEAVVTEAGILFDSADECAHCAADYLLKSAAVIAKTEKEIRYEN